MSRTERLDILFEKWQREYPFNVFMKDGIVSEDKYENVLFILKDVNNAKPDDENDMRIDVQTSNSGGNTWFNVARWTSALLDGMEYSQLLNHISTTHQNSMHDFQHVQLRRAAIVNLKKEAGGSSVSNDVVNEFAHMHKEQLWEEIRICSPKIIIVCGTGIFDGAKAVLGEVTPVEKPRPSFEMAAKWEIGTVCLEGKDIPIIQFRHPSTGCSAEKSYRDMLKIREYVL